MALDRSPSSSSLIKIFQWKENLQNQKNILELIHKQKKSEHAYSCLNTCCLVLQVEIACVNDRVLENSWRDPVVYPYLSLTDKIVHSFVYEKRSLLNFLLKIQPILSFKKLKNKAQLRHESLVSKQSFSFIITIQISNNHATISS